MESPPSLDSRVLDRLRSERSDAFLAGIIDLFLREAPLRLEEAWQGGRLGDARRAALAAHALACLAANVGATEVRRLAGAVEGAAADRLPLALYDLEVACAEARSCLLRARPARPRPPASRGPSPV